MQNAEIYIAGDFNIDFKNGSCVNNNWKQVKGRRRWYGRSGHGRTTFLAENCFGRTTISAEYDFFYFCLVFFFG